MGTHYEDHLNAAVSDLQEQLRKKEAIIQDQIAQLVTKTMQLDAASQKITELETIIKNREWWDIQEDLEDRQ